MNEVKVTGELNYEQLTYDHTAYGERFYRTHIRIQRASGYVDTLPVIISADQVPQEEYNPVSIYGQYRSFNDETGRLILYVFVTDIVEAEISNENNISLEGYLCKQPTNRQTPLGRTIADLLLAVPRPYGKNDYIPVILWNRNANMVKDLQMGDKVGISGRIQSRKYIKNNQPQTAYEVSAYSVTNLR